MELREPLSGEQLAVLARLDTCSVANAIETFDVRLRNAGYMDSSVRAMFPDLPAIAGYAVPGRIRSAVPPRFGHSFHERTEWWDYILTVPVPRIVVIQDLDEPPGAGALLGDLHAAILKSLDCVGYVTNGSVRYLPSIRAIGLQMFASGVSVSHGFAHLIDFGSPVTVGGLSVSAGDLLHADLHGVLSVPAEIASRIPPVAERIKEQRREIIAFCQSPKFSIEGLRSLVNRLS